MPPAHPLPSSRRPRPDRARTHRGGALAALAAAAAALLLALGGCGGGGSSSGTSASPASVVPAAAPLYVNAVVAPSGTLKSDALAVGRTLTGNSEPYAGLLKLLAGPTGKTPSEKEVKPWLGPNAGVFVNPTSAAGASGAAGVAGHLLQEAFGKALAEGLPGVEAALTEGASGGGGLEHALTSSGVQGALVLDTTSESAAKSFLEAQAHAAGAHSTSLQGVSFWVAPDGVAEGVVHRFAVIGSEAGVKSVIETAAGGAALAGAADYAKLADGAQAGRLANAYIDIEALTGAGGAGKQGSGSSGGGTAGSGSGAGSSSGSSSSGSGSSSESSGAAGSAASLLALLDGVLGHAGQAYVSLIPGTSTATLDVDTLPAAGAGGSKASTGTTGAQVLRGLPGDAWLAIGFGDLGRTLSGGGGALGAIGSLLGGVSVGSFSVGKVFAPLSEGKLNVQRDLLSWMGATGVYVGGSSILNLQAAVVIEAKNAAAARAAVGELGNAYREAGATVSPTSVPGTETAQTVKLPGFPLALTLAYGDGKFVAGLGAASVQEALHPQSTLAGTPTYNKAASALGEGIEPSAAIEFATLTGLIESLGLNAAPGFSGIAQALKPLSSLAAGGGKEIGGGVKRARVVLALTSGG